MIADSKSLALALIVPLRELMDYAICLADRIVPVDHHFTLPIHMQGDREHIEDC